MTSRMVGLPIEMETRRGSMPLTARTASHDERVLTGKPGLFRNVARLIAIGFVLFFSGSAFGQIPNAGFEEWHNGFPDGWAVNDLSPVYQTITSTTYSHSGKYALVGTVVASPMGAAAPTILSGPDGKGFACSERPAVLRGWHIVMPLGGGDRFVVNACLYKGGPRGIVVAIASAVNEYWGAAWSTFEAPFVYRTNDVPDTAVVTFTIIGRGTLGDSLPRIGSTYRIDDLSFVGGTLPVGTPVAMPASTQLLQNYPNPFNPSTTIGYRLPGRSHVLLAVYTTLGQQIAVLEDGEQDAGYHEVLFDGSNLSGGVYFYRIQAGAHADTKRFILVK